MIKKVHYCWFGGKLPSNVASNVEKWKRLNPDFEFCEWNDGNIDVSEYAFGLRALKQRRWAFVSDIVRLQKLQAEGGVYLDTDVELIRPLNTLAPEGDDLVLGYMHNCSLGTAVIYSPPGHPLVAELLEQYHHIHPEAWPVNNTVFTDYFINDVPGFLLDGRRWKNEASKISLYQKEFFEQPTFLRNRGFSIHHFSGSWMPEKLGAEYSIADQAKSHKIKWLKRKIRTFFTSLGSDYRRMHWRARLGRGSSYTPQWRGDKICPS